MKFYNYFNYPIKNFLINIFTTKEIDKISITNITDNRKSVDVIKTIRSGNIINSIGYSNKEGLYYEHVTSGYRQYYTLNNNNITINFTSSMNIIQQSMNKVREINKLPPFISSISVSGTIEYILEDINTSVPDITITAIPVVE